jgi:integral membrane protein (TIGR00529 family)
MNFLLTALPFIKVIGAFCLILVGLRNRLPLAFAIFLGGWFMALSFHVQVGVCLQASLASLVDRQFLLLVAIVGFILILSDALEKSGQSQRLMTAASGFLTRPRLRLIFFPALIGLLPMPGGAVFSAPMIKAVSEQMKLGRGDRVLINYWFRHVWEMAWPLYPGIILTVALAGIPVLQLISKSWPGVVAMFAIGWFFFLRPIDLSPSAVDVDSGAGQQKRMQPVLQEGLPLLIAIVGAVTLETVIARFLPELPFELGVIAALLGAIACVMWQNRLGVAFLGQVLRKKSLWAMLMVIAAIFVFKGLMQVAGVVAAMAASSGQDVALFSAAVILPFLVGAVAGINVAFVGATFPLLIGLLRNLGMESVMVPYLVLGTFAGFAGVMVSPIHICFVLTCNYFGANLAKTWRRLLAPTICFGLVGGVVFWILL